MGVLIYNVLTATMLILVVKAGQRLPLRQRFPVVAVVITALILGGLLLQAVWSHAMNALDSDPSRAGWWRPVTSVLMQNGGLFGDLWNVVTIAVVAALAEWYWGRVAAAALFLAGALVPHWIDVLLGAGTVSSEPRNWAGSSGATYFLGATLAGALLIRAALAKDRLLAVAAPALGLAEWFLQDNAHGLIVAYGFVLGALVAAATGLLPAPRPADGAATVPPSPCRSEH